MMLGTHCCKQTLRSVGSVKSLDYRICLHIPSIGRWSILTSASESSWPKQLQHNFLCSTESPDLGILCHASFVINVWDILQRSGALDSIKNITQFLWSVQSPDNRICCHVSFVINGRDRLQPSSLWESSQLNTIPLECRVFVLQDLAPCVPCYQVNVGSTSLNSSLALTALCNIKSPLTMLDWSAKWKNTRSGHMAQSGGWHVSRSNWHKHSLTGS